MEVAELNIYLNIARKNIKELEAQIKVLDGGNWNLNVRGDDDKEILYSNLQEILSKYRHILKRDYYCEK